MRVLMFRQQFWGPIRDGSKRQTIRHDRKAPIEAGETLGLRGWTSLPYRSPQFEIVPPVVCAAVREISVSVDPRAELQIAIMVAGRTLWPDEVVAFSRRDGFAGPEEMAGHYLDRAVLGFVGVLIEWEGGPR